MNIIWLGHSGFRIEIGNQILLIDPWFGNPLFPEARRDEATAGATAILISHGHFDHIGDAAGTAKALDIPVVGKYDLVSWLEAREGCKGTGFNTAARSALAMCG